MEIDKKQQKEIIGDDVAAYNTFDIEAMISIVYPNIEILTIQDICQ